MSVKHGPDRGDGFPRYVIWAGERFKTPTFSELESWVYDSVCESLTGDRVEPDGTGPDGAPSWLLALHLI